MLDSIKAIFRKYDVNGDGTISKDELRSVLQTLQSGQFQDSELDEVFSIIDKNKDGKIQYAEFVDWLADDSQEYMGICCASTAKQAPTAVHAAVSEAVNTHALASLPDELDAGAFTVNPQPSQPSQPSQPAGDVAGQRYRPGAGAAVECAPVGPHDTEGIGFELDGEEPDFLEVIEGLRLLNAKQLRTVFQDADVDKNGFLQLDELKRLLFPNCTQSLEAAACAALTKVFVQMDKNSDGKIACGEFVSYIVQAKKRLESIASEGDKKHIAAAFGKADVDASGGISMEELQAVLGVTTEDERRMVSQAFESVDTNSDGTLSILEFSHVFGKQLVKENQKVEVVWNDVPEEDSD